MHYTIYCRAETKLVTGLVKTQPLVSYELTRLFVQSIIDCCIVGILLFFFYCSRVVSVLNSAGEGPGFKSQP